MATPNPKHWWRHGIVYQVYVRSFMDSKGDGVGDLAGVTSRLDYLEWLGVDALWLTPIYPSPMADFGYDVASYTDVDPIFGTLDDFDRLVAEAHRRGLRVLLDYVPNHTSDRHPWFLESRSSRDNPRRDWYLWRDPAPGGGPPNNWLSIFGGGAWEWDEPTGQYYFHTYLKEQPDLNWRNPEVEAAMFDALRFWLDRGVAGFRIDAISRLLKDAQFRDNPPNPRYTPGDPPFQRILHIHNKDQPETLEIVQRMRQVVDAYGPRVLIGEAYLPLDRVVAYYGGQRRGVDFPFNFLLISRPWQAESIRQAIDDYERAVPPEQWPNWVLGNHDRPRVASRVGPAQARVAAMLLLTLRGTPTMYYGDEIGMQDVPIPPERVQDPRGRNVPGHGLERDPERTPMQWSDAPQAGFTSGQPWLPLAENFRQVNVAAQRDDPVSLLSLYHRLIHLRRVEPALCLGDYVAVDSPPDTVTFLRAAAEKSFLISLNFTARPIEADLGPVFQSGVVRLSTRLDREDEAFTGRLWLRAHEGLIVEVS